MSQGYQKRYNKEEFEKYKTLEEFTISRNNWTIDQAKKHQSLIPFCSVPIKHSWSKKEIKRCLENNVPGIKLHLASENVSLKDEKIVKNLRAAFKSASDKMVFLIHLNHHNKKEIELFFTLAREFPRTKIIVAHNLANNYEMLVGAPRNIYTEISSLGMWPLSKGEEIVKVWRAFGIEKVLFGSDWPVFHPQGHLYLLNKYPLTDMERELILRENGKKLFFDYIK